MATDFTRRQAAQIAAASALLTSVAPTTAVGQSATEAAVKSIKLAQAATDIGEKGMALSAPPAAAMQRADELLRQMTLEEKAMQLSCIVPIAVLGRDGLMRNQADILLKHGIGHVAGPGLIGHKTPETLARSVNAIQRYLVTETRLKFQPSSTTRR
jgi:hypothetical protein